MLKKRSIFLYPLSLLYGLVTDTRNFLYNAGIIKSVEFGIPVICVGNITAGGTGKTPHTEYLIDLLRNKFNVAVLSRGYKRRTSGFRLAERTSTINDIGDEPWQISRKFPDITVAVDGNRVRGAKKILELKPETGVIIMDDGYQHRSLTPGFSILLSDYNRPMTKDHMLPYGNLRESLHNTNRADIIIITKSPENISPVQKRILAKEIRKAPYQNLYFTSIKYQDPVPVFDDNKNDPNNLDLFGNKDCGIVLVTGIANPDPLLEYLKKKFREIEHLRFDDHHSFTLEDIEKISLTLKKLKSAAGCVFTTEKDAARLRGFTNIAESLRLLFYYIPVGINFLNNDKEEFDNLIISYVRKNKRNNRVSERKRHS
jgi:tetraacyldisaccharide 4'-kinase